MMFIQTEAGVVQRKWNVGLEHCYCEEKVPRTLVVFKMASQCRKEMAYMIFKWKFMCTTIKPHVIKNTGVK